MKYSKIKPLTLTALASSLILAGCVGGGGGNSGSGSSKTETPVNVGGIAASGHLKNARVIVYCGKEETAAKELGRGVTADGTGGTTPGQFSVTVTAACSEPLKIVVKAHEQGGTKMVNKLDGTDIDIAANSGLKLRRFVAAKPSASVSSEHVTPVSDMVAAIAERQTNPTASTVSQAQVAIANVFNGNMDLLNAEPKTAPVTPAEKQLYQLGAAVEQMAAGAGTTFTPDALKTALETLAASAKDAVTVQPDGKLAVTDTNTSGLAKDLTTAIAALPPAVTNVTTGTSLSTTPVPDAVPVVENTTATAIAAAKNLFNALKADFLALWNDAGTGFLNTKVAEMDADFKTVKGTGVDLVQYVSTMIAGADMVADYDRDYVAQGNIHNWYTGTDQYGTFVRILRYPSSAYSSHTQCKIYTSGSLATSPTSARCFWQDQSSYVYTTTGYSYKDTFIKITAVNSQAGTFKWENNPRTCTGTFATAGVASSSGCAKTEGSTTTIGDLTLAHTATSTTAAIKGQIQPMVVGATATDLDISANGSSTETATTSSGTVTMTGKVSSGAASFALLTGTQAQGQSTATGDSGTLKLVVRAETSKFRYDGTLSLTASQTVDSTHNLTSGSTDASFSGSVSTLANGTATAFFEGSIGHKATLGRSSTTGEVTTTANTGTVTGKVTNSGKVYDINYAASKDSTGTNQTLTYTNPNAVKITVSGKDTGASTDTATITSGTTTVTMKRDSTGTIKSGTTEIGTVNKAKATFIDGTYMLIM